MSLTAALPNHHIVGTLGRFPQTVFLRYARRGQTVEPFNDWFKVRFELDERVWYRGFDNNRTQLLAAIFGYQLLVRYNHCHGHQYGQVKWILDQPKFLDGLI